MSQSFPIETVRLMKENSYTEGVQFGIDSVLEAAEFDSIEELLAFISKHRKAKRTTRTPQVAEVIQGNG